MSARPLRSAIVVGCALLAPVVSAAQDARGTVRDSASAQPLASAIVVVLDSADATLARTVTNEQGAYRVALPTTARRLRVLRIGFRPQDVRLGARVGDAALDVTLVPVPPMLSAMRVEGAAKCPRRADGPRALALWDQARTGLLATVVAREAVPAQLKLLLYERTLDGTSDRIVRQRVRIDSSVASGSFAAVGLAEDFVARGFVRQSNDDDVYLGPDADVMLDPAFAASYCFSIRPAVSSRPNEAGLGFESATRRDGRIDIDGTLWVDTVARAVRSIEFRYVGLDAATESAVHPGGRVSFHTMPNGVVMVDRWNLHVPAVAEDTRHTRGRNAAPLTSTIGRDIGGEVARAIWDEDGREWRGQLGTLRATIVDARGRVMRHATVRLADTDYLASPDFRGNIEIEDLLPGPYAALVIDTALARLGASVGMSGRIVAERDSVTETKLVAKTVESFIGASCRDQRERNTIDGMIVTPAGAPAQDARWELGTNFGTAAEMVAISGGVDERGRFAICPMITSQQQRDLQLRVWRESAPERVEVHALVSKRSRLTITLPRQ